MFSSGIVRKVPKLIYDDFLVSYILNFSEFIETFSFYTKAFNLSISWFPLLFILLKSLSDIKYYFNPDLEFCLVAFAWSLSFTWGFYSTEFSFWSCKSSISSLKKFFLLFMLLKTTATAWESPHIDTKIGFRYEWPTSLRFPISRIILIK